MVARIEAGSGWRLSVRDQRTGLGSDAVQGRCRAAPAHAGARLEGRRPVSRQGDGEQGHRNCRGHAGPQAREQGGMATQANDEAQQEKTPGSRRGLVGT